MNNLANTSPRQMLLTNEPSSYDHTSVVTDAILNCPIDKSMRGKRQFEKTSYRASYPIRCSDSEKSSTNVKADI